MTNIVEDLGSITLLHCSFQSLGVNHDFFKPSLFSKEYV